MNTNFDDIFQDVGTRYGVDPALLKAQAMTESGLDPSAVGPQTQYGQAQGIAQLMPATAQGLGADPTDPRSAIEAQAKLLRENLTRYGSPEKAVLAYHGGTNEDNWGPKTHAYLQKVSTNYQQLKSAANSNSQTTSAPATPQITPQDDFEKEVLGSKGAQTPQLLVPQDDFEHEVLSSTSKEPSQDAFEKEAMAVPSVSPLEKVAAKTAAPQEPFTTGPSDKNAAAARDEVAYGLGDVPRSLAKTTAAVAPKTFNAIASAAVPAYAALTGQQIPTPEELATADAQVSPAQALQNELQQRNAEYQGQYGADPQQAGNRLIGQIIGMAPVMGAAGKGASLLGQGVKTVVPALSPVVDFLGGKVTSNALVSPTTGATVQGATLGNRALQYLASGTKAAELALPVTAATDASSETPVSKQLAQNAIVGGAIGTAAPAAFDVGTGIGNAARQAFSGIAGGVEQKAQNVLQKLTGADLGKLDTTQYVPGSKPTLAEAAVENPNVAALSTALKEGNPAAGQLVVPELTDRERANDLARRSYLNDITGTPDDLQKAKDARSSAANLLLYGNEGGEAAAAKVKTQPSIWEASTKPTDVQPVVDMIDDILKGPNRKNPAVVSAMTDIKDKLVNDNGSFETDPETLYRSVIKDINDKLDRANPMDAATQNMQSAAVQVKKVKDALNASITDSTPGYKNYLNTYSKLSRPVDEMNVLQNKLTFLNQPSDEGVPTLAKVNKAIDSITKKQNASGFSPYDSVSDETLNKLQNLQKDLQRSANPNQLLRITNSATDPKIAARRKVEELLGSGKSASFQIGGAGIGATAGAYLGGHVAGPVGASLGAGVGEEAGRRAGAKLGGMLSARSNATRDQLVQLMLDPTKASAGAGNINLLRSYGQLPELQNALTYAAPMAVQGNRLTNQ